MNNNLIGPQTITWQQYRFEKFGIASDIFANTTMALMFDPSRPNQGYLAQEYGSLSLMVEFGQKATLQEKKRLFYDDPQVVVEDYFPQCPKELCSYSGIQCCLKVTPRNEETVCGFFDDSSPLIGTGYTGPFFYTMISVVHRGVPLMGAFKRPLIEAKEYIAAQEHFFVSFRL